MTMLDFVLVDDDAASREGRKRWLVEPDTFAADRRLAVGSCVDTGFEEALAFAATTWEATDVLVVDALDERAAPRRRSEADHWQVRYDSWDYVPGHRVIQAARAANPKLTIIVVSGIVNDDPYLSRLMRGAGADFTVDKADVLEAREFRNKLADLLRRPRPHRAPRDDVELARVFGTLYQHGEAAEAAFGKSHAPRSQKDKVVKDLRRIFPVDDHNPDRAPDARNYQALSRQVMGWLHRKDKR